ncbi:hypothetical protein EAH87_03775 [Sphingomonas koreensis]|nr:hypothetical protein EAH87_03775 [Sphingomonas koreensis]
MTQIISVIFVMHAAPSRSILLSMGRPQLVLLVAAIGTAIFFACALLLIPTLGAMGASIAQIVFTAFIAAWLDVAWHRGLAAPRSASNPKPDDRSTLA